MRSHPTSLRVALSVLLAGSAILFFVGATVERNKKHHETTPAAAVADSGSNEGSKPADSGEQTQEGQTPPSTGEASPGEAAHAEAGSKLLGVNTESHGLSIAARAGRTR